MTDPKETISLYRKGIALAATREGGHITGDYNILGDVTGEDGTRTITLRPRDKAQHIANVREFAGLLAEQLGEGKSKLFKGLLEDTLIDYEDEAVERMLKKIKRGQPVKAKEGCFRIIIGDGRRNKSETIMLRE